MTGSPIVFSNLRNRRNTSVVALFLSGFRHHVVALFSRQKQVLECLVDVIANSFIQNGGRKLYNKFFHECSRDVLDNKLLACPPERSMSKIRARDFGTMTSFWFSLGTWTYRVSPGLASEGFTFESDALDSAKRLHCAQFLFIVRRAEVI